MTELVQFTEIHSSGVEVRYTPEQKIDGQKVKRKYEVRSRMRPDGSHNFDWFEVPSVTSVLNVLHKPLSWHGMTVGVDGIVELVKRGELVTSRFSDGNGGEMGFLHPTGARMRSEEIVSLLTAHRLTVNDTLKKAGDRGDAVHKAAEVWARTGFKPDPEQFMSHESGYVEGFLAFLEDAKGVEPIACEVMVGSVEHGFAGRYDLRLKFHQSCQVVYHRTPVRGPKYATIEAGTIALGDLKTSKGVYLSHSKQLEGYEIASLECGYEPTDARGILHVSANGDYEFVRSQGVAEDFLTTLAEWKSQEQMKARKAK